VLLRLLVVVVLWRLVAAVALLPGRRLVAAVAQQAAGRPRPLTWVH
jgi:hypothetical protein